MKPVFLGKESTGGESPTLYATDRDSYVIQGWMVADLEILALIEVPDDETLVEITPKLMTHLAKDGLLGTITRFTHPIVHVKPNGNFIVQGARVTDAEALAQMDIPDHETCVEVSKASVVSLLSGGGSWN
ncbi:hypothetical protein SAMN05421505_102333 [Sinosporangium album]|uniref:Uncharacterized protein n=1 Tax=Sinosporangium album TaxID=504805 RepID=A0A1G7SJI9_9ACTN|nr:hypothetical protein [Sinosporangium album]SDG23158.1 hypothetical protein SAMN05421505_102333 [Sinosporangium album]